MIRLREGKWRACGSTPGGCSATSRPRSAMARCRALVLGRIEDVDAAGDDRDRSGLERAVVRGGVDAAGEPGDDDRARLAERLGEAAGEAAGGGGGVARAHERDGGPVEQGQMAFDDQSRRRGLELGEQERG
jgi:hypothetical protein